MIVVTPNGTEVIINLSEEEIEEFYSSRPYTD